MNRERRLHAPSAAAERKGKRKKVQDEGCLSASPRRSCQKARAVERWEE